MKTKHHSLVRLLHLICVADPMSTMFFSSESSTYCNCRRLKSFFSFIETLTRLLPMISARKCANTTEKMSSRITEPQPMTKLCKWRFMSERSWRVPWLFAYLHVHGSICVCAQWTIEKDVATLQGKCLLLWTQVWCKSMILASATHSTSTVINNKKNSSNIIQTLCDISMMLMQSCFICLHLTKTDLEKWRLSEWLHTYYACFAFRPWLIVELFNTDNCH